MKTIKEAAEKLNVTTRTIRYWIEKGTMLGPMFEDGFVKRSDLNNFAKFYKGSK